MGNARQVVTKVRAICLSLPEVQETTTFGNETWRVGKKTFAVFERYHGEWVISFKATHLEQEELQRREGYFVAPYVGQHGWTCLKVEGEKLNWRVIESHIRESYRLNALKRHLKQLTDESVKIKSS